jgi:hypothetical protein
VNNVITSYIFDQFGLELQVGWSLFGVGADVQGSTRILIQMLEEACVC